MFQRALVSVSDKTGLDSFLRPYVDQGMQIVSSGGTSKFLKDKGFIVTEVAEQTGFPEVFGGRVKTLHPYIHMPLLARPGHPEDQNILQNHGLKGFDLVVVNLYPFAQARAQGKSWEELVEFIDIGGPCLLRASAKNYQSITVVCDPEDYKVINSWDAVDLEKRKKLAQKVFEKTAAYDRFISEAFVSHEGWPNVIEEKVSMIEYHTVSRLRYGENPQQSASWCNLSHWGLHQAKKWQGKELSYNNLLDLQAASQGVRTLGAHSCVAVKHTNPCGVAVSEDLNTAIDLALKADPVSVFGGIVGLGGRLGVDGAHQLKELFLECILAPEIDDEALEILSKKKNLRVLTWPEMFESHPSHELRSLFGGFLQQDMDEVTLDLGECRIFGDQPSADLQVALNLAWKSVFLLKSNAIAITNNHRSLGFGMGQVNRVDAVEQALDRWKKFHPDAKENVVLASDAFFPFPDSVELAHKNGIQWIVQPGGSIKDEEVIQRSIDLGVNMVLTGKRHFKH